MNQPIEENTSKKRQMILLSLVIVLAIIALSNITYAQTYTWSGNTPPTLSGIDPDLITLSGSPSGTLTVPANKQVTIEGTITNTAQQITLNLGAGSTVYWNSTYSVNTTSATASMITISGNGGTFEIESSGSVGKLRNGTAINVTGSNMSIIVDGTVSSTAPSNGSLITLSGSNNTLQVESGGSIQNTANGTAIHINGSNTSIIVSGGTVSAASGSAIDVLTADSVNIEVNSGLVFNTGTIATNAVIYSPNQAPGNNTDVTIKGTGVVEARGISTGYGIVTYGNVTVMDAARVSATANRTIDVLGEDSIVTVSGGTVSTKSGQAIYTNSSNSKVIINGGMVVAEDGYAIFTNISGSDVTVSDGFVFAYGSAISGPTNVIRVTGGTPTISGDGVAAAWDQSAGNTVYNIGTALDLDLNPAGSVVWDRQGPQSGISYSNGANSGFFPVNGIKVGKDTIDLKYYAAPYTVADVEADIAEALADFSTVYVINTDTSVFDAGSTPLNLTIPSGKKIEWSANYTGSTWGLDESLIFAEGSGTFEFTGGTVENAGLGSVLNISQGAGFTVIVSNSIVNSVFGFVIDSSSLSTNSNIIVSGGTVSTTGGGAIGATGPNSSITVSGGTVSATIGSAIYCFSGNITVSGGTVSATSGAAINMPIPMSGNILINGGFVFAYGTAIEGTENVINCIGTYTLNNNPADNGVVVAWDQGAGNTAYVEGTNPDLIIAPPAATVTWHNDSTLGGGISYANGANTGFFPLGVTIQQLKDITSFEIAGVSGTITAGMPNTITLTLPYGTDVTSLTPTIVHTGVSVSPNSGTTQDFTTPMTYTVTATDTSTKEYVVTVTVAPNTAKEITKFEILGVSGIITAGAPNTILLTLPYGTDVTNLLPAITHTGASVSPVTAQDFTNPVTYTVTADDMTTKDYVVTVVVALNSAKDITNFEISGVSGIITAGTPNTILLTLPYGTDVTTLMPAITHTGASVSPSSGMMLDFTNPVTYTVTADDTTTKDYVVTVAVAPDPAKDITSFEIAGISGIITAGAPNTIILTLPYGTDITALTPTITHTGVSVSPANGMMQDFSSPVTYTVTAADTTTKDYVVTVAVAPNPAKDITSFEIAGISGIITAGYPNTIILTLPYGTDVTALTPLIVHTGVSISPANGMTQDFSSPVTYTVTAADTTTKSYVVTVVVAPNPAKDITNFEISGVSGTITAGSPNTIILTLPYGTDATALTPAITHTGVSISPANGMIQDFSSPVTYTVTAADTTTKSYVVTVVVAPDPAKDITNFEISGVSGIITAGSSNTIILTLPYGTNVTALTPAITHTGASISPANGMIQNFTNPVTYTVTAADTTTKDYVVTVVVAPNPAKDITRFEISGIIGTITTGSPNAIVLILPYGTDVTTLMPAITHTGVSISPANGMIQDFSSSVTYTVTAADTTTKDYVVTVMVAPNPAKDITNFEILGISGTITAGSPNTIILTLPYDTNVTALTPAITHTGASISPANGMIQDFTTPVTYTVTAADTTTKDYVVTVVVAPNPAKDITNFEISGVNGIFTAGNPSTIILTLPYGTDIKALTPAITHTGMSISPANGMIQDFTNPVIYTVTAADTTTKDYFVAVMVAPSSSKDITKFEISGVSGIITAGTPNTITLTFPYGTDVTALTPTIVHTGVFITPASGMTQDFTNPVTYTVMAGDTTTKDYVVTVTVAPNPAKDITSFEISGVGGIFTAGGPSTIILTLPFDTDITALTPTIMHTGASISPANGMIQDFTSPVIYTVTAADMTTKDYFVAVMVAPNPAKDITRFEISGMSGIITAGDPNTITLTLPYGTDVTALTPTIMHTGVFITPASGMAQDFTNPVTYTVMAGDTTTKDYVVTVTVAPNPAKDITLFEIAGVSGTITAGTPNTITLTLPYGTDVTALTPAITHTGVAVSPANGMIQNFINPVTYRVTAADGSTKDYVVTVTVASNPAKDITRFEIAGVSGTITDGAPGTIDLTLPYDTDITALTPAITHTGVSVSPANGMIQDFSSPVTYIVTAADTTTKSYVVTVTVASDTANEITSFMISGVSGTITVGAPNTITLTLPYGADITALTPTITHTGVSVSPANGMMWDFSSPVTYTVTAADTTTNDYVVTVSVDAKSSSGGGSSTGSATIVPGISPGINESGSNISVSGITLDRRNATIVVGETLQLTATIIPENAMDKGVQWSSSDPSVATVDDNGMITTHKVGTATITATTNDGRHIAICEVTVTSTDAPPTDNNSKLSWWWWLILLLLLILVIAYLIYRRYQNQKKQ